MARQMIDLDLPAMLDCYIAHGARETARRFGVTTRYAIARLRKKHGDVAMGMYAQQAPKWEALAPGCCHGCGLVMAHELVPVGEGDKCGWCLGDGVS